MSEKLAVISGATGGIGNAVVESLWAAGYSIIAQGRTLQKLDALIEWFRGHHRDGQFASVHPHDLADRFRDFALESMLYKKEPTLLVVCHGAAPQPCAAADAEDSLRTVFETDVMGTYKLCTAVGAKMCARGAGSIVIVSSLHARATYPHRLPYTTCKAALSGLVRGLALEYGQHGVTVNTICPWQVAGDRTQRVAEREHAEAGIDTLELYRQRSPMRRFITASDIAQTVLWLAECKGMNGAEIVLDGGVSASMWHRPFETMGERDHGSIR